MSSLVAENIKQFSKALEGKATLIAVSKTKPVEDIAEAYEAGHRDFGENKIQEMADKYEQLPKDIRWHMIGHVQGNKIKYMAPFVHLVHGIDKAKRLKELDKEAAKNDRVIDCLLQVHIAKEDTKFGFDEVELTEVLTESPEEKYPNVRIRGLMGMATFTDNELQVRNEFKGLFQIYSKAKAQLGLPHFDILSMGMSGDYQLAIDEGSNMVRIGSSIFGERNYQSK
ncbi:pyridoxal phosphate enzyme, YggS family [Owenweeksia hongkongensis DSM 17368]|uniref:Pyridoxal phosphate homeostasis protein n=1 Tax=Owenweeksia hongkongensis (strain DSM 17368 / CIP 108786 / JCM 12287 / NRRL B-23963 / UST20020801) TaxID=926562 RepID=G8QZG0_OWEHD|nr:YggS family pyridoxal phosphate-dependent enzyme [Owenweeksia hongkongensis]AEV32588.1 pyridoxal phosphate enzyme, YggS family [Owenweeksia hongkongensis DSM 17368]